MGFCHEHHALKFMRHGVQWVKGVPGMLTGIKIAFVGGDARIIEVIRRMSELDAVTRLFGFDRIDLQLPDMQKLELSPQALAEVDVVVLPVAGMNEDGTIDAKFSSATLMFDEDHFAAITKAAPVFTGIARPRLMSLAKRHGLNLIKLMELDEVAILNSIPTAEGAIAMAMENTEITIHGSTCAVLGLGRSGMTLARVLAALGAQVLLGARKEGDLARAKEMGLTPFSLTEIDDAIDHVDIIFNTIPAPILTSEVLTHVQRSAVIIDIASAPGGTDFRYAERRGIKALLAPSLPGMVAPKTAGRIIAQSLERLIREQVWFPGGIVK